jgi:hypothetical protein
MKPFKPRGEGIKWKNGDKLRQNVSLQVKSRVLAYIL